MDTNRGLKNRTPFATAVETSILNKFKDLSKDTRIPQSKLLDEALEDLLNKYDKIKSEK